MRVSRSITTGMMLAVAVIALCPVLAAAGRRSMLTCRLTGNPINNMKPSGESEFVSTPSSNATTICYMEIEIGNVNVADKTTFNVKINNTLVGTIKIVGHVGRLNLSTNNGAKLPVAKAGDKVNIQAANGVLLASGTYQ